MNESMPSRAQPPHAAQNPRTWFFVRGVLGATRARSIRRGPRGVGNRGAGGRDEASEVERQEADERDDAERGGSSRVARGEAGRPAGAGPQRPDRREAP